MTQPITQILDFWFGDLDDRGFSTAEKHKLWFTVSDSTDQQCKQLFGALVEQAVAGKLNRWADKDEGLIALVLLLDQFTRNIFRGTPAAFSGDDRALALSQEAIEHGRDQRLPAIHRVFLYMPLEHSEDLLVQETSVNCFAELAAQTGDKMFEGFCQYAQAHKDVVSSFGRFPHRNSILGRESTQQELEHLGTHGGF